MSKTFLPLIILVLLLAVSALSTTALAVNAACGKHLCVIDQPTNLKAGNEYIIEIKLKNPVDNGEYLVLTNEDLKGFTITLPVGMVLKNKPLIYPEYVANLKGSDFYTKWSETESIIDNIRGLNIMLLIVSGASAADIVLELYEIGYDHVTPLSQTDYVARQAVRMFGIEKEYQNKIFYEYMKDHPAISAAIVIPPDGNLILDLPIKITQIDSGRYPLNLQIPYHSYKRPLSNSNSIYTKFNPQDAAFPEFKEGMEPRIRGDDWSNNGVESLILNVNVESPQNNPPTGALAEENSNFKLYTISKSPGDLSDYKWSDYADFWSLSDCPGKCCAKSANSDLVACSKTGFLEYRFPVEIPDDYEIKDATIIMEVSSELPGCSNEDYKSDITASINGHDLGTWTSPNDPCGKGTNCIDSGWETEYGTLKKWLTDDPMILDSIKEEREARFRLEVKSDATNQGGLSIWGKNSGTRSTDPTLYLRYASRLPETAVRNKVGSLIISSEAKVPTPTQNQLYWSFDKDFDGWERTGSVPPWHTMENGIRWYDHWGSAQGVVVIDACERTNGGGYPEVHAKAGIKKLVTLPRDAEKIIVNVVRVDHDGGIRVLLSDSERQHTLGEEVLAGAITKQLSYDISAWSGKEVTLEVQTFGAGTDNSKCTGGGKCCGEYTGIDWIECYSDNSAAAQ